MSVHAGAREITDGLIVLLDASNVKSYPGTGNTVYDLSGNGNHFTIEGNITWNKATGFSNFNGNSLGTGNKISRVGFPTNLKTSQGGNGYTVMVFANSTGGNGVWCKLIGNTDGENYIDLYQTPSAPYGFYTESGDVQYYNNAINVVNNTLTMSDSVYRLYIGTNLNGGGVVNPVGKLSIGNEPNSNSMPWIGNIMTVLLYNRVLTTAEMAVNFNALRSRFSL